ncbi:hypothetical protein [Microbispora hainanensis]|uniref:Uncharacterized protein n=1 Tax=Microbispora hainanensis TaxID=568844 RepID=A0A544YDT0_9ACTN|nr:hypothetical protein [Microbispora hainanensis]TQS14908.1 hypothetical protein FLX08_33665 [Microbispora hainanensis]
MPQYLFMGHSPGRHDKSLYFRIRSPHTRRFSRRPRKCSDLSYGKSSLRQGLLAAAGEGINLAERVDLSLTTPFPVSRTGLNHKAREDRGK